MAEMLETPPKSTVRHSSASCPAVDTQPGVLTSTAHSGICLESAPPQKWEVGHDQATASSDTGMNKPTDVRPQNGAQRGSSKLDSERYAMTDAEKKMKQNIEQFSAAKSEVQFRGAAGI